jgi:hypothetical protein
MILVGLIPSSFASSQNSTLDQQGNYHNPSLGMVFPVPEGWIVEEPKKTQAGAPDVAIIAPYSGGFTPSISFIVEKANNTPLSDYFENKKNQIVKDAQSQNVVFLSEQDNMINGHNAKILILRENFVTQGQNTVIKFKEAIVLANGNFYTISYANEEKNFDTSLSNYDNFLNSITFSNGQNLLETFWFPIVGIGAAIVIGAILVKRKKERS